MKSPEKNRIQNQDDWKRTQLRIPFEQYDEIAEYAKNNNLSLNSAILELASKGLSADEPNKLSFEIAEKVAELLNKKSP